MGTPLVEMFRAFRHRPPNTAHELRAGFSQRAAQRRAVCGA
jgi:hypothetical protein